jgi:glycosyltransferase involved in cell wall biosynthesis
VRFGLNGLGLLPNRGKGGVANYISSLIGGLARIEREHEIVVYLRNEYHELDWVADAGLEVRRLAVASQPRGIQSLSRLWTEQAVLPAQSAADRLDVLHSPDHVGGVLRQSPCPQVVTICDLTVFSHPETHSKRTRWYMQGLIPPTLKRAARVICISHATAVDVNSRFGIPFSRIDETLLAAGPHYCVLPQSEWEPTLQRFGVTAQGYYLFLGTLEPRKNVDGLLRAYRKAMDAGIEIPLVIAGRRGRYYEPTFALVESLQLQNRVIFTDYVSNDEAIHLYNGAAAFAFPSHYEGFGLPVLEAMACGAPVITTNVSSLPELAAGSALLVEPADDEALAAALVRIMREPGLRETLRSAGIQRAGEFSWERCAQETIRSWEVAAAR